MEFEVILQKTYCLQAESDHRRIWIFIIMLTLQYQEGKVL